MSGRGLLFLFCLSLLAAARPPGQADGPPDWRFGLIEAYEAPERATEAGAAWTRIRFHWADVQDDGPDSWTLKEVSESQIDAEAAAGRLIMGLLIGIPDWARDDEGLPRGLWLPPDDPDNLWASFVREAAGRYRGRIDHWVIWNEPDIWDKQTPGHTWDGTVEDFAQLQRTAYLAARQANPHAVIHLSAFTYFWDANYGREQYFDRLLAELTADLEAAANNHYFDVATAHLYFNPDAIFDILTLFHEIMTAHGLDKPLWLVETNAPPIDDPMWPVAEPTLRVTLGEQAAFMPQVLAIGLAAGADRTAVYKLKDRESDVGANPEPFGLLRMDGTPRDAFTTFRLATSYLSGVTDAERERWDAVGQVRLEQGAYTTTVLFARLPMEQEVQVEATAAEGRLVDMWGEQEAISAEDGYFTLTLPPALCSQSVGDYCMIGGTTYYLIQAAPGGAIPATLPAVRVAPTVPPPVPALPSATPTQMVSSTQAPATTPTMLAPTVGLTQPPPTFTASPIVPSATPTAAAAPFPSGYLLIGSSLLLALALVVLLLARR